MLHYISCHLINETPFKERGTRTLVRMMSRVPYFADDRSEPQGISVRVWVEDAESKESQHHYEANDHKESDMEKTVE